ncbi:hypothetical protein [Caldisericum exile]|uniref:hypothetical protein n=1 Tax=Caldisericum exile TaxID=693075 RepID=UPI003C770A95
MSVKIYNTTKIYIACPANYASGGPELLHQLGYHFINDLNVPAFMYYYNFDNSKFKTPVHPEYEFYNVPYTLEISEEEDIEKNILIVPEILSGLSLLPKYKNIRKGVWFLSVDNYYFSRIAKKDFFFQRALNKLMRLFHKPPLFDIFSENNLNKLAKKYDYRHDQLLKLADFYITNSNRGMNWFKDLNPLYFLSEYLNPEFLKIQTDLSKKENIIAYNPKKGFSFTKKIISSARNIKFVPLINMSREEVIKALQKAKVYIDFGNHPGKDRLPREAAILGCCVITGKRGSAAFFEDVPIPDEYKFEDREENIPKIIEKIRDCFENFKERYKDFDYYRQVIKNEPQKFVEDLRKIFVKVEK